MKKQNGNALFLILIAVALFAALSYAVTTSGRGGSGIDRESAKIQAAILMQHFAAIDSAVQRMRLRGINLEALDWTASGINTANIANSNCTSNDCKVFDVDGGGVTPMALPLVATDASADASIKTADGRGSTWAFIASVLGHGTDLPEAIFVFRGIDPAVCEEINVSEGILGRGDTELSDITGAVNTGWVHYHGSNTNPWPSGLTTNALGDEDARIDGHSTFCINRSASLGYYLYHIVSVR